MLRHRKIKDLGTAPGDRCSDALSINNKGQIVGTSWAQYGFCEYPDSSISLLRAVVSENGSIVDLNTTISSDSNLYLVWEVEINDRGEIAGIGVPPGVPIEDYETHGHAFLLFRALKPAIASVPRQA